MDYLDDKKYNEFPRILDVFIILAMTFSLTVFAVMAGALIFHGSELLLAEIVIILPALLFVKAHKKSIKYIFRLHFPGYTVLLSTVLISLGTIVLGDELDRLVQIIFPMPQVWAEKLQEFFELMKIHSLPEGIIIVTSAVIFAGLFEEMLFRGFVQQSFEKQINVAQAIIYSAIVFAFFHLNPWQLAQITITGVVLGYLSWKSDSIFPAAILHGLNNGLAVLLLNVGDEKLGWYTMGKHVKWVWLLLAVVSLYLGFLLFSRSVRNSETDIND